MKTDSLHLLAEYHGCDCALLDDPQALRALMLRAVAAVGATPVSEAFHRFSPHGVTGVIVLEESHFSVHTWPEAGYAAADLFTCGELDAWAAHPVMLAGLGAKRCEVMEMQRGGAGLRVGRREVS